MVFSSTIFLFLFLPIVVIISLLIPKIQYKNIFLLFASLLFYAYGEPKFIFIMLFSIFINYILGFLIEYTKSSRLLYRRIWLIVSVLINVGLLFYYKYYDFFIDNVNTIFGLEIPLKHIILPIGISFFTFQIMSYLFDLYLDRIKLQKNPLKLALYISFFPQLIAGPIVKYIDIETQIDNRSVTIDYFVEGIKRFIIGLGKKILIANSLAIIVDEIFAMPVDTLTTTLAWIGAIAFTLQIYFDFSGYSDMAIGLGYMFGFKFLENFNYPYIARNITDYWKRWHISLTSWFRNYVYLPLSYYVNNNITANLLIVFMLTGLWHGASWNYVIWGLWHGLFLIFEHTLKKINRKRIRLPYALTWFYAINIIIVGEVIFKVNDLSYLMDYIKVMYGLAGNGFTDILTMKYIDQYWVVFIMAIIFSTPIMKNIFTKMENKNYSISIGLKYTILLFIFALSIIYTVTSTYNPFLYFQF